MKRIFAVGAVVLAASGCRLLTDSFATNDFSGDNFPTTVETQSGAVIVGMRQGDTDHTAVLDLLSPITLVDPGPDVSASVHIQDVTLLGQRAPGQLDLPRARFKEVNLVSLHPCADPGCAVGATGQQPFDGIVGADSLAGDDVRLNLGFDQIFVLADVAGNEVTRADACDAVFPSPYRGGGTLVIGGTELQFAGRRPTMLTCLGNHPEAPTQDQRGTDALMLVSTGIGVSLLGESAFARYQLLQTNPTPLEQLPAGQVFLASGPIFGHLATIDALALVGRSDSTALAPCRQVFAHHLLLARDCSAQLGDDCPCENDATFCPIPAIVEVEPAAGIPVLVISDDEPTLQALRTELRPDQAEVDGILGVEALRSLELDIDYPHDRILGRCSTTECATRPALAQRSDRAGVQTCIDAGPLAGSEGN